MLKHGPFIGADGERKAEPPDMALVGSISWQKLVALLQASDWCDRDLEYVAGVRVEDHGLSIFYEAKKPQ